MKWARHKYHGIEFVFNCVVDGCPKTFQDAAKPSTRQTKRAASRSTTSRGVDGSEDIPTAPATGRQETRWTALTTNCPPTRDGPQSPCAGALDNTVDLARHAA